MIKTIILFDQEPFTERSYHYFHIEELKKSGFEVQIWDLSKFLHPSLVLPNTIQPEGYKRILSVNELQKAASKVDYQTTLCIIEVDNNWNCRHVRRIIKEQNLRYIAINNFSNSLLKRTHRVFGDFSAKKIKQHIIWTIENKLYKWYFKKYCKGPDFILSPRGKGKKHIPYNHPDYEDYITCSSENELGYNYIVFIDWNFPLHPDFKAYHKQDHSAYFEQYQEIMTSFFEKIEQKYNLPVIIACHPKSNYNSDAFGGRVCIKGNTASLVKHSTYAINQLSNSMSHIILANKPNAIVTTNYMNKIKFVRDRMNAMSYVSNIPIYNIENSSFENFTFMNVPKKKAITYIHSYLTTDMFSKKTNIEIIKSVIYSYE